MSSSSSNTGEWWGSGQKEKSSASSQQVVPSGPMSTICWGAAGNHHVEGHHHFRNTAGVSVGKDCGGIDYKGSGKPHNRTIDISPTQNARLTKEIPYDRRHVKIR